MRFVSVFTYLLVSTFLPVLHGETARGVVFHDENADGARQADEKGVSGALVSNGWDVIETSSDGSYQLEVDDDTILFVIKPAGWDIPVNENNLPQFYYIHKPKGSPDLKFAGVPPTGPLPESVDFALYKSEKEESFPMLAFGDPQPYTIEQVDFFARDIVSELANSEDIEFGVVLGDIVGDDLELFAPLTEAVAQIGQPFWYVYGNHDMNFDVEEDHLADETFERVFGPTNYAFTYGNVHFVAFDNVLFPQNYTESRYIGGFTEKQFSFLESFLEHVPEDDRIVAMMHIPLFEQGQGDTFVDAHRERFFQLFRKHPNVLSLSAHTHYQKHVFFGDGDGWPHDEHPHHHYNVGTTSGSWWRGPPDERGIPVTTMRDGTPNGYAIIHFKGTDYAIDWKVANASEDFQMSIFAPKVVLLGEERSSSFFVNFFNGNERSKLEYRHNGGEWESMDKVDTFDPAYTLARLSRDASSELIPGRPLPHPVESSHLWGASMPRTKSAGTHRIEVRATDMFGRVFHAGTTFRVAE